MSLSKPILSLLGKYLENLYIHPVRTKSLTSCVLAATANVCSQLVAGEKSINTDSIVSFAAFGLFFGGTIPHYFYSFLENFLPTHGTNLGIFKQLFVERLIYTPSFQTFSLYVISRLEGKNHNEALLFTQSILPGVLRANWTWLTLFHIINLSVVPPILRVLFVNIVGFFWVMFVAKMRRVAAAKGAGKK